MLNLNLCWIFFVLLVILKGSYEQDCTSNGRQVGSNVNGGNNVQAPIRTYILTSYGSINCYGTITRWSFYKGNAICENVRFQVWRPTGGLTYRLIGENDYNWQTEGCDNYVVQWEEMLVPADKQIPVEPGDIIGWTKTSSGNAGILRYDYIWPDTTRTILEYTNCDNINIDGTCSGVNPPNPVPITRYWEFSLLADLKIGAAPVIANLPYKVQVFEDNPNINPTPSSLYVYDVKASHEKNNEEMIDSIGRPVPLSFSLDPSESRFSISTRATGDHIYTGNVTKQSSYNFDYEVKQLYTINVTVEGLALEDSNQLTVEILDMNEQHTIDNPNQIRDIHAQVVKRRDQIFQLLVSDPDTINPSVIEYFMTRSDKHGVTQYPDPPFIMDRYTGVITADQDLDTWVGPSQYVLTLEATDYMYTANTSVTVNINGVRGAPVIRNLDSRITISEDSPDGSEIFQVVASGVTGSVFQYYIVVVDPFKWNTTFGIHQTGWIYITNDLPKLDYTVDNQMTIQVEVSDGYQTSNIGTLTVGIGWVNQAPAFVPDLYSVNMPEACGILGTPICQPSTTNPWPVPFLSINVEDRDVDNGIDSVTCEVLPGVHSNLFDTNVQGCTTLNVIQRIDVNIDPQYMSINLTLKVTDNSGLSDTAEVKISVYDINDNTPQFVNTPYGATIEENTPGGVSLFTVKATDMDFDENGEITYSIQNTGNPEGTYYFEINYITGELYTKHPVDYEALSQNKFVSFNVRATDGGNPAKYAQEGVRIDIKDVNDNHPAYDCVYPLDYPWDFNPYDPDYRCFYNRDIPYDTLINHLFMVFQSTDADTVTQNLRYYKLNVEPHFRMETSVQGDEGHLFTDDTLYNYHMYALIIMTTDQGTQTHPELKARPPSVVRVDTFDPAEHLVDITLGYPFDRFNTTLNKTDIMMDFISIVRTYCKDEGWFIRLQGVGEEADRVQFTIYALVDNSTFLHSNFEEKKYFVGVNDLLHKLRKNIKGHPRDDFYQDAKIYNPVEIMPTHPKFLIHTIGGLVTLLLLLLFFLFLIILMIICCCKRFKVLCFKPAKPTKHAWMHDNFYDKPGPAVDNEYDEIPGKRDPNGSRVSSATGPGSATSRRTTSKPRRPSLDTVHSVIYDTKENAMLT